MEKSYIILYTIVAVIILVSFIVVIYTQSKKVSKNPAPAKTNSAEEKVDLPEYTKVLMHTNKGDIMLELRQDLMPYTVNNFIRLVKSTFYNGLYFHRVEPFLIQSGDPSSKGLPMPKWNLKLETNKTMAHRKYAVGMARQKGGDTASTQYYILKRDVKSFDGQFAVFGKVIEGFDVIEKIEKGDVVITMKEVKA